MNQVQLKTLYVEEEDRQLAHIISTLIWAQWGTFLFVFSTALYYLDWVLIAVVLVGSALQIVPWILLRRGHLRASSLIVVLIVLGVATIIATIGQGIRDISIAAFPIVFTFAGLVLNRAFFRLCVGLALAAVFWLALGENYGWFISHPFSGETANWIYLFDTIIILLVAALAVDLLATNMRNSLERAQFEIVQRKSMEKRLRYQSMHDALTNIYNRAFFMEELERLERGREYPVSIIVADADKLKIVNDTHGHIMGDRLLQRTARVLQSMFRESDVLARIGGDEFAVLLPTTTAEMAEYKLFRVQEQLAKHNREHPDLMPIQLSLGVATAEECDLMEAFMLADRRMYADKAVHNSKANPRLA